LLKKETLLESSKAAIKAHTLTLAMMIQTIVI